MADLTGVVYVTLTELLATFDAAMTPADLDAYTDWLVVTEPAGSVGAVVVVSDVVMESGNTQARITIHPELTPGIDYRVTAPNAGLVVDTAVVSIPAGAAPAFEPSMPHGIYEALTESLGEELQELAGRPDTYLLRDLTPDAALALVESTVAFPASGRVWVDGEAHLFTSRSDGALEGVTPENPRTQTLPRGARVVLDVAAVLPP